MAKHFNKRKRVDFRHNHTMDLIEHRIITLTQVPTAHMRADFLTKQLGPHDLRLELSVINMFEPHKTD